MSSTEHLASSRAYQDSVLQGLKFLYESKYLSDVQIVCRDDWVIDAHKCILTTQFDFSSKFLSAKLEAMEDETPKMDFSAHSFATVDAMVSYIYTGDYCCPGDSPIPKKAQLCFHIDVYSLAYALTMPKLKALALQYCYGCTLIEGYDLVAAVGKVYGRGGEEADPDLKDVLLDIAFERGPFIQMFQHPEDREILQKYPEFLLKFFERVFEEGREVITW